MERTIKQVFLDGICGVFRLSDGDLPVKLYGELPLEERTVGARRSFDAMQAGHSVQRVIRVPVVPEDLNGCYVETIQGRYEILLAQRIFDTCPNCLQLTLEQVNICWAQEQGERNGEI